ncbi:hypothetical protein D3C74_360450 [compost metagenome]
MARRCKEAWQAVRIYSGDTSIFVYTLRLAESYVKPNFVAITASWRRPRSTCPMISSLWPVPYTSAVSRKLIPSSNAVSIARIDSVSSTSPQPSGKPSSQNGPPIAQPPKPSGLTCSGVEPKVFFSIFHSSIFLVIYILSIMKEIGSF